MHVPWGWIKQRPHFLAEELSDSFKVDVVIPKSFRTSSLTINESSLNINPVLKLPLERFKFIRSINSKIVQASLKYLYGIHKYKYIWITDLRMYPLIQNLITSKQKLIYDCMDDVLEFTVLKEQYQELETIEKKLFRNIDLALFSSKELQNRKVKKYNLRNTQYGLVYNALDKSLVDIEIFDKHNDIFSQYKKINLTILTYIGTISSWFDFDLIERSLNDFKNIVYFIIGPIEENIEVLKHDRIKYFGSVEHKYIKTLVIKSDILIMPFKINKLIEAVDPVKMYEYIAFGKKIISINYNELDKFSKYINTYNNYNEFKKILQNLNNNQEVGILKENFVELNSWESRKKDVIILMKNIA